MERQTTQDEIYRSIIMLIFLGDSNTLGIEISKEELGGELLDQHASVSKTRNFCHGARPDYAYPDLVAKRMGMDYINLGMAGGSNGFSLYQLQCYLKECDYSLPENTYVIFLETFAARRFLVDCTLAKHSHYMTMKKDDPVVWQFLNSENTANFLDQTSEYDNIQIINHLYTLCKLHNLKFIWHSIYIDAGSPFSLRFSMLPDSLKKFQHLLDPESDLFLKHHPSIKGHKVVANELCKIIEEYDKNVQI